MTRVVHVVLGKANPERMNGINRIVHELATAQLEAGGAVEVWGLTDTPAAETPRRAYRLSLFRRRRLRFLAPRALGRALLALPLGSVLHLHGGFLPEMAAVARAARRRGLGYVLAPHGAFDPRALLRRRWVKGRYCAFVERRLAERARAVHVGSPAEREAALALAPRARLVVLPNGQRAGLSAPAPEPVPEAERPRFGFCGRLDAAHKGLDLLLEGFAHHVGQGGGGTLELAGDGPDRESLERRARGLGLTERVRFRGPLFGDARRAFVASLDLFVHTSRHEGMPMAVLEAAALARPLLLSRATNLADDAERHGAALVCEPNEPLAIAARLREAEERHGSGQLAPLGEAAAAMVRAEFSWDRLAARAWRDLYALAPPPADRPATPPPLRDAPPLLPHAGRDPAKPSGPGARVPPRAT